MMSAGSDIYKINVNVCSYFVVFKILKDCRFSLKNKKYIYFLN